MKKNKIAIVCKLSDGDAFYFTEPFLIMDNTDNISVFRDSSGVPNSRVEYITTKSKSFFRLISRLFQLINKPRFDFYVGIYEIPHGILAYLASYFKKSKSVICIIGNPALTELRKGFRKKLTYFFLKRTDVITVTGSRAKDFMVKEGFPADKVKILPNSIDIKEFQPADTEKKFDLITLGRLSPEKKLDVLLEIVEKIKMKIPEVKVGIAGRGPEYNNLERLIKSKGLEKNAFLTGFVANPVEFLNSGKLFITCSMTEGLPRTVIQSMACGVPAVVSNVGDMIDLVDDNKNGFLIDRYDDTESFSEKCVDLLSNKEKYKLFAEDGIKKVDKVYSHKAAAVMWLDVFRNLGI